MEAIQLESGWMVGSSRKAAMMLVGQSPPSITPCPVPGNSKKKLLLSVLAASLLQATGVAGSYSPASTSVGRSLLMAAASLIGEAGTFQMAQVSNIDWTAATAPSRSSGRAALALAIALS